MAAQSLEPWTIVFGRSDWDRLVAHHFRADEDEHGSALLCGVAASTRRRLLVREVILAHEGRDYVPSAGAYRALAPRFVSECADRAAREGLAYLAVHNHLGEDAVAFSDVDLRSHERGYPALLDITRGGPVGALVLARRAAAGDIWTSGDRTSVAQTIVLGGRREIVLPRPAVPVTFASAMFDRQARLFGNAGQALLGGLKVGIVGAGGAGSMLSQALAHLGIGELVVIDDDRVDHSNRPRTVGSVPSDAAEREPFWPGTLKTDVARRLAIAVNPRVRFYAVSGNVVDRAVAEHLLDCDALFLAADSMQARHVFNAICHQYRIPGFQVGAKVQAPAGQVEDAFAVSRMIGADAGCLWCSELINATKLQEEALSDAERQAVNYVETVSQPSVITMNAMSTAFALNDFLFMFTGLSRTEDMGPRWYHFLRREPRCEELAGRRPDCRECGTGSGARGACGDRAELPVRGR